MTKKLKMALAGGGPGAFIGAVHRIAAELDGEIELVSGVFSSDPERSLQGGRGYGLSDERIYPSIEALVKAETARPDGGPDQGKRVPRLWIVADARRTRPQGRLVELQVLRVDAAEHHGAQPAVAERERLGPMLGWKAVFKAEGALRRLGGHGPLERQDTGRGCRQAMHARPHHDSSGAGPRRACEPGAAFGPTGV